MRFKLALAILVATAPAAFAQGFEIVVPNRPGVPIVVNGVEVNYSVLEGNFGLGKGYNNQPTIYGGRPVPPEPEVGHYYPTLGLKPAYGRLEIEPPANRKLPPEAESYYRSWSAQSTPQLEIPANPPPVIVAPQIDYDWQHGRHPRPRPLPR